MRGERIIAGMSIALAGLTGCSTKDFVKGCPQTSKGATKLYGGQSSDWEKTGKDGWSVKPGNMVINMPSPSEKFLIFFADDFVQPFRDPEGLKSVVKKGTVIKCIK